MLIRKLALIVLVTIMSLNVFSQSPSSFNYQAVLRDNTGKVKVDENVKLGIIIKNSSENIVFSEEHLTKTNSQGLITLAVGSINKTLDQIEWAKGDYFVTISVDDIVMGESQLLTVPFSMYTNQAKIADLALSVENGIVSNSLSNYPFALDAAREYPQLVQLILDMKLTGGEAQPLKLAKVRVTDSNFSLMLVDEYGAPFADLGTEEKPLPTDTIGNIIYYKLYGIGNDFTGYVGIDGAVRMEETTFDNASLHEAVFAEKYKTRFDLSMLETMKNDKATTSNIPSFHSDVFIENSFEKADISMNTIQRVNNHQGVTTTSKSGIYTHDTSTYEQVESPINELKFLDFYKVSFNFTGYMDLLIASQEYSAGLNLKDATIGFWIDKKYFSDQVFFNFQKSGTKIIDKQYLIDLELGYSVENANGKLKVKDQIGDYVYIQVTSKIGFSNLYLIISSHNQDQGAKEVLLGGVSYVLGDVELHPRVKYKTRGEAHFPNLQGKKVCFIGDSTTSGMSLINAFVYFTGVREIVNAAISGASIGNPTQATGEHAGNWIYNFKDFIIANNPDIVVYNISSNDTAWKTGSLDDVDDDSVSQSFYKYYYNFMKYILSNNTDVLGSGISNLGGTDKCHLLTGWYTNIGESGGNGNMERRLVALKMKKAVEEISDYFCCNYVDIQKSVGARIENNLGNDGLHPPAFIHNRAAYKQAKILNDFFISNK